MLGSAGAPTWAPDWDSGSGDWRPALDVGFDDMFYFGVGVYTLSCVCGVYCVLLGCLWLWYGMVWLWLCLLLEQRPGFSEKAQVCTWRKEGRKERKEKEAGLIKRLLGKCDIPQLVVSGACFQILSRFLMFELKNCRPGERVI